MASLTPTTQEPSLEQILAAQQRIAPYVRRTPLLNSEALDAECGARLFFKCENLQEMGAFKIRGAINAVFAQAPAQLEAGVITHSSGNHGAAVARAAQLRGVSAWVVMPENCAASKLAAVRRYGGQVVPCAPSLAARETVAARLQAQTGAVFIHPYDDPQVICGQGTIGLELLEELPQLDVVLLPIGGGGLASGVALAIKALRPAVRVIGVEPALADDAARGYRAGALQPRDPAGPPAPATIADGLRGQLSDRTFVLIRRYLDGLLTVGEADIVTAMRALWTHLRVIIEPSSAVPYAALLARQLPLHGQCVAIVLTGGNVDLDRLPWCQPGAVVVSQRIAT